MLASRHGGNGRPAQIRSGVRQRSERSFLRLQFQSRRENRFRPLRNAGQFTRFTYLALNQAKNKTRFRRRSGPWIGFFAVVIKQKLGQSRKQPDQIEPALSISFTNFPFWNVVSAVRNPGAHARYVALHAVQTHVPNPDFNSTIHKVVRVCRDVFGEWTGGPACVHLYSRGWPVQASLGRGFSAGGRARTGGNSPARSLFRA